VVQVFKEGVDDENVVGTFLVLRLMWQRVG